MFIETKKLKNGGLVNLLNFQKRLNDINISLEIVETNSFKIFFDKLIKKDFSIYWNKVYEPDYLKFDNYLLSALKNNNIHHKRFKGNALNEVDEIKKAMVLHLKYSHLFGEQQKNIILRKYHQKKKR